MKFLHSPYPYILLNKDRKGHTHIPAEEWIFRFDGKKEVRKDGKTVFKKEPYLFRAEIFHENLIAIKFHLRALDHCKAKYNRRTEYNDAIKVLSTALKIMKDILNKKPFTSFCFVGSSDLQELSGTTKRFQVYQHIVERDFSPVRFEHMIIDHKNIYLLANRSSDLPSVLKEAERIYHYYSGNHLL